MAYRLGIDLGSTSVAAAIAVDGGPAQMIMLGGTDQLPSTLYVTEDGAVLVGAEAASRAASDPGRAVVEPLRRLAEDRPAFDDGTHYVAPESGVAALLRFALDQAASARVGEQPNSTIVSHPVDFDDYQRACLLRAVDEAGLPECSLLADLEAAARGVVAANDPGPDTLFMIMDLGGGSCAVGLARRTADGTELQAHEGSDHPCGADFDEAVFRLVGGNLGDQGRELTKDEPAARARAVEVRQACRQAKEILSTSTEASVTVGLPGVTRTVRIGRPEFESLVRPALRDALGLASRLLQRTSTAPSDLIGVALVGGASRMPVVAELVEREWSQPVVISQDPSADAARGLVSPSPGVAAAAPATSPIQTPIPAPTADPASQPQPVTEPIPVAAPVVHPPVSQPPILSAHVPTTPVPTTPVPIAPVPTETTSSPVTASGPPAGAPTTEQPMPDHLIFDYFAAAPTEPLAAVPSGSAMATSPASPRLAASMPTPPQRPVPPGQRPMPPVPPGQRPGPPMQPYGAGRGPGGPGGYPPQSSGGGGPFGSRRNLVLAIIGAVVLIGAAVGIGFWFAKPDATTVTAAPSTGQLTAPPTSVPPTGAPSTTAPSTSGAPSASSAPSTSASSSPTGGGSTAANALPAGPPIGPNLVVVPMTTEDDDADARPLYLVDTTGGSKPQQLDGPDGKLSNPMLQKDRTSIIFVTDGVLHVMASDGTGERDLTDREPAGCDNVTGATWDQTDPTTMVISCKVGAHKFRMLVVDTNGKLIRRLDAGKQRYGDVTLSPDGQTILYWASDSTIGDGGSLYTLPIVGTGAPKKITSGAKGLDGDPAWSPDGSQIAFRRLVGGASGNADVYVMNADGSGQRAVADTDATDVKPVWSPDGKNLLVVSNRKSAFGKAGKTWDLWVTRVSDGEVLNSLGLKADGMTTPVWSYR